MNINKMMKQAQAMQKQLQESQERISAMEFTGVSGAGAVNVTITGGGEMKAVSLKKDIVDPEDIEVLEDLIVAAFNDAKRKADETTGSEMSKLTGGMGLPPGMKLPF